MKTGQAIIVGLIIGFLGGVGAVQATMGNEVRSTSTRVQRLEKDTDELRTLLKEFVGSNRELVSVMKLQGELLRQYRPNKE